MAYLVIEDFKGGLDKTRMAVMAKPGSLQGATNVHITRGGEIEKAKSFVETYTLPEGTFGMHSVAGVLYVFGSASEPNDLPTGVEYQRLQDPDGSDMTGIIATENFDGKIYAIAEFSGGDIFHFYDGERVTAWDTIATTVADNDGVATVLASRVNARTVYTAAAVGSTITIQAAVAGTPFTISAETTNGGTVDDQTITLTETQENVAAVTEVLATGSIDVTGGTASIGVNTVASITVDGVDILGSAVDWTGSNSATATAVAAQINSNTSSPEYSATASGPTVIISAATGTGDGPNGFVVDGTVGGNVTLGNKVNMAGGVDAQSAQRQIYTAEIGGTFEVADTFTITLDGEDFTASGGSVGTGLTARTLKGKVYSTTQSLAYFCAVDNPTQWGSGVGSGLLNVSTQSGGSDQLTALGIYQNNLAIFARRAIQIEYVDPDPALNQQLQVLNNIGTVAPHSVVSFGDSDVFFLSESGVRSLRARDSSNSASVSDVGTPVDQLILDAVRDLDEDVVEAAVAIIEPIDGRYWLALGDNVYVFSFFPAKKVSAWTTYDCGFTIEAMAYVGSAIYARSGDVIYRYGGADGDTYDSRTAEVEMPFLNGATIATWKSWTAIDLMIEGLWKVYIATDPEQPDEEDLVAIVDKTTLSMLSIPLAGYGPLIKLRLVNESAGAAKIGGLVIHYEALRAD